MFTGDNVLGGLNQFGVFTHLTQYMRSLQQMEEVLVLNEIGGEGHSYVYPGHGPFPRMYGEKMGGYTS